MLQYSSEVRAVFVTTHVGYAEVPGLLTKAAILDTIELGAQAMRRIRGGAPDRCPWPEPSRRGERAVRYGGTGGHHPGDRVGAKAGPQRRGAGSA